MSNTIPLKEKLDFQQYQLVINALSNIGIEIDVPHSVEDYAASLQEKEVKETPLKENEQLFKIELPLAEPLFLTDKKGGEMIVITKDTYNKLLIRIEELETINRGLKERYMEKPAAPVAPVTPAPAPAAPTAPVAPAMAFTTTEVTHIPEPQSATTTHSPMAFTTTPVIAPPVAPEPIAPPVAPEPIAPPVTPEPIAAPITHSPAISQSTTTSVESTHTFSTVDPLSSTNPLVPHTITTTSEEATYHKEEPTSTYQTPISSTLHQNASNISNEEALERARRIIEKYKK